MKTSWQTGENKMGNDVLVWEDAETLRISAAKTTQCTIEKEMEKREEGGWEYWARGEGRGWKG